MTAPRRPLILWVLLGLVAPGAVLASGDLRQAALDLIGRGVTAFQYGDVEAATRHWTEAIRLCRTANAPEVEAEALARRGEAYRVEGHFREAAEDMRAALAKAREAGDAFLIAASAGALGNLAFMARRTAAAEPLLEESLAIARRLGEPALAAASSNDLGNLYAATSRPAEAAQAYSEAVQLAAAARDGALGATARINAARLALDHRDTARAVEGLASAVQMLEAMGATYQAGLTLVAAGSVASGQPGPLPAPLSAVQRRALESAAAITEQLQNPVLASLALGGLGRLNEQAGRAEEASRFTRFALFRAQQASAPDLSFRWEWQQARLDRGRGREDAALAAYRRAIFGLGTVRQEIPIEYRDGRSSFQTTFGPLYKEFADLLLRRAGRDRRAAGPVLREVRETLEQLKESELQDYFRDACVTSFKAKRRSVERVAADTAVLYPVVLPDRLELLVSVGGEDHQVTVPMPELRLRAEVEEFRRLLETRTTNQFLEPAQRLHALIARPVEAVLAGRGVGTLVVVPDAVLRTMPFAALHDGERFWVERYAMATVPGLRLVEPRPLAAAAPLRLTLVAGLSLGRQGFSALPNVFREVRAVQELYPGLSLVDSAFLRPRFAAELQQRNYSVVHIASHGEFGSDPSRTFVLAYDGPLTMDDLEGSIKLLRYREEGLELLTLSACQTAAGDDRATLGLAGLALKSGARSAVATLWLVNDQASGMLIVEFYRQLQGGGLSKAQALRAAQRMMLEDPVLAHPAYWAPFLLIGNWL